MTQQSGQGLTTSDARFPDDVRSVLLRAGWFEGRNVIDQVSLVPDIELFPAARDMLAEFGLLMLGPKNDGSERLGRTYLFIEPTCVENLHDDVVQYEPFVGSRLYPVGFTGISQGYIFADEQGRIWLDFGSDLLPLAPDFDTTLIQHIRWDLPTEDDWRKWDMKRIPHIEPRRM